MGLKAIFKNKITVRAILFTLFIFIVFRLGANLLIPGANVDNIINPAQADGTYTGYLLNAYFQTLGGGSLSVLSLFMLGVAPYVTASIIIQLLETELVPAMDDWKKQGVDGQRKRAMWTRITTIIIGFLQAFGLILVMSSRGSILMDALYLRNLLEMAVIITAGVAAMMWLADRITEFGVGNGISVIIMANILASMPYTLQRLLLIGDGIRFTDQMQDWIQLLIILIIQLLLIIAVIYYNLAVRKVHINYVRSSKGKLNEKSFLPIKINPAGVIPIIFVGPLMALPGLMITIKDTYLYPENADYHGWLENLADVLFNYNSTDGYTWIIALLVYFALITGFSVLYSYIQMNPENMTENLEKQGAYVVGVRPGESTEKYFEKVINKTSIIGGAFLGLLGITPIIVMHIFDVSRLAMLGTSLIIVVSVIIQSYEGLLNKVETKKYRKLFGEEK